MSPEPKPINWIAVRIAMVAALFAVGTVMLLVRSYQLGVSEADALKERAEKQRRLVLHLESRRGMILDRSGEPIAASLEVNSVYARPHKIPDKRHAAGVLAPILEMDPKETLARLNQSKPFVWLQRRVSPLVAEKITTADLRGVFTATEYQRFYPLKNLAAHAIGFAGLDSKGLEGLELFYDDDLRSDPIPITAQRDALGRPVMFATTGQTPKRRDIHLTLDRNIQFLVERELEEGVKRERAKSGVAVVLDADSGEILSLAVSPGYNLNVFEKAPANVRRNRAVADTFEPGSTFKVFLAATALDLGRIDPTEKFFCHGGLFRYNGAEIHDIAAHKWLSFDEVMIRSSNIGAVKISEKLKKTEFYRVLQGFGFGELTGVDLPGERPGFLPLTGKWSVLTKANLAFGQGMSVTPVQLAAAFAAAVNGGTLYRPHLVKGVTNAVGETVREVPSQKVRTVIKQATSEALVNVLRQVVQDGTGRGAAIAGADVVGKTGTAQKADPNGGYSQDKYVASFIGALMGTRPRVVIFVMLDEPAGKLKTGGKVAAPLFRKIGEGVLALCGSKPEEAELILASTDGTAAVQTQGYGKRVKVRRGQRKGEWIVPDLKGFDMRQVLEACGKMKCDASFQGYGRVVGQTPKPGSTLKEGDRLAVTFEGEPS